MRFDWTHTRCACRPLGVGVLSFVVVGWLVNFFCNFFFGVRKQRPSTVPAMEESEWTQQMDLHLLHLLTELPSTPSAFPEVLNKGRPKDAERIYYQTMQNSFLGKLTRNVDITSIRKGAAWFLGALEPLSEVIMLLVRAVHACTTVEDIRERVAQRDSERTVRADRANVFRTTSHTIKRTATDVAAESRCTCGTTAVDCPLGDYAHYVLRRSVPGGAESERPRVEEFMCMAGQSVDTPAQNAFLEAARMLAPGLPSEKEAVFLALLKEGVCGSEHSNSYGLGKSASIIADSTQEYCRYLKCSYAHAFTPQRHSTSVNFAVNRTRQSLCHHVHPARHHVRPARHRTPCTPSCTPCTPSCTPCTLHSIMYTLPPVMYALHSIMYTYSCTLIE